LFSLILDIRREIELPIAQAPSTVLDVLAPVFAPRKVWFLINGEQEIEVSRESDILVGSQRLWLGESLEKDAVVTRFVPQDDGLGADIQRVLRSTSLRSVAMSADGALRYRQTGEDAPAWHGRWRLSEPPCLLDLAAVRFQLDGDDRLFEFSLSFSGFPLTSSLLLPDGSVGTADSSAAHDNRMLVFRCLSNLPAALGVPSGAARWSDDGDYGSLYRADADEIRGTWLPLLNAATSPSADEGDA
jgi:hypothetical protein